MNSARLSVLLALVFLALSTPFAVAQYQMQVYGLWHCYDDACSWASVSQHDNLRHQQSLDH